MMSKSPSPFVQSHYAYGCFFFDWVMFRWKKLLMLDTRMMEFSIVDLPPGKWSTEGVSIVEAGEGRLGMFGLHGETASDLSYTIASNKETLPNSSLENTLYGYFSLDVKTFQLQRVCMKQCKPLLLFEPPHVYTNFPPSLLPSRTI
ncbi:hypothetical protein VPH35_132601 [Triticum aestivum]